MDFGIRSRSWNPVGRKLLIVARAKANPASAGREDRNAAPENAGARIGMDSHVAKGKARINSYEALLSQETERRGQDLEIYIPPGPRLGQVVIEALGLKKAYGDRLLFEDLNFGLPPGGIVGVIGPNGAGKTTLFRLISGQEKPDAGS